MLQRMLYKPYIPYISLISRYDNIMKILFYFLDMLPGTVMEDTVEKNEYPLMREFLHDFTGTFYTNAYTPSPDTPRSIACLFTAATPKIHGCSTRDKWPGHFMASDELNQLLFLQSEGFEIFTLLAKNEISSKRFLPNSEKLKFKNHQDILSFKSSVLNSNAFENSFFFVQDNIFHDVVDERSGHESSIKSGLKQSLNNLRIFFDTINKDNFDLVVLFSDHGFKPFRYPKSKSHHLDDIRIKIFLHISSKGDTGFMKDNKLRCISDIFPIIFNKLNIKTSIQRDHLSEGRDYVVVEDHGSLGPNVSGRPSHWKIIFKNGNYLHVYQEASKLFFVDSLSQTPIPIKFLDSDSLNILIKNTVFFKSSYFDSMMDIPAINYKKWAKMKLFRLLNLISCRIY